MHCTTFYSYKGGVGRTLALVNVAVDLSMRDKKVLIVDFDLEAPGITTLNIFAEARNKPGVVDFIHEYLNTSVSPSAEKFIHACEFGDTSSSVKYHIDVMPAGDQSASYGTNFANIDWRNLYDEKGGFLLIEDLRKQWAQLGYDYVLIDSRTGLTDVSGICTRQLPDSVVMVFFPNEQNLVGLQEMAQSIRESSARPEVPQLLFVASRLPRLDDENGVLERWLDRFKTTLGYSYLQICSLDQYDSLSLLDQDVFVISRPKTGLSKQYRILSETISQLDSSDARGAVAYINSLSQVYSNPVLDLHAFFDKSNPFGLEVHSGRLNKIESSHINDVVVQRGLAEHYYNLRDFAHLEVVLRHGLAAGLNTKVSAHPAADTIPRLYQLQMRMGSDTGEIELSSSSAVSLLACDGANERMIVEALMLLVTSSPSNLPPVEDIRYLQLVDIAAFVSLMNKFGISSREAYYNCKIAEYAIEKFGVDGIKRHTAVIELALIAGGSFLEALSIIGDDTDSSRLADLSIPDAFNRTMALWGRDGYPSLELFKALLPKALEEIDNYADEANFQQCVGLIYAVLGNVEMADVHLSKSIGLIAASTGRREVSCWSFVEEPADDFVAHCGIISDLSRGDSVTPIFVRKIKGPLLLPTGSAE
ncbi:MAG: tyrosine-protein kinase family protein [Hymenobacter sp.]|nr:MAG: tyrosine-protein kinase family protein [Hymenobacter sp.]